MARLEFISYRSGQSSRPPNNTVDIVRHSTDISKLPQIIWDDHQTWNEVNLWAFHQATLNKNNLKTVKSNMTHLLAYAKWLEEENVSWAHFPERESQRCLVRFRGYIIRLRDTGELAPSTASQRMAAIIRFYRWASANRLVMPEWEMWKEKEFAIKVISKFGLEHSMRVASTDLTIPNRKVSGSVSLEDGLLPVSIKSMKQIIELADRKSSKELALMLRLGFFTGMRIGSITDLKVDTLENAYTAGANEWKKLQIGPRARPPVATKNNCYGSVLIPTALLDMLLEYSSSSRRLKRQVLARPDDKNILFLTRFGNRYAEDESRAINVEMLRLRNIGLDEGIRVFKGFHFHRTRATFATELTRLALQHMPLGDAIQFVKEACLHRDEQTTMKYIKFIEVNKAMEESVNAFSSLFMGLNQATR